MQTRRQQLAAALTFVTTVGVTVIANVAAGFYLGKWLDERWETYPWARIGGIVLGYVWQLLFDGILGKFDLALKLNAKFGFWGLVILICWQQIGYMMIIYIAGLQSIPGSLIEAAKIDGANAWQRLIHVVIPNMMPSITICTFLTVTNSFKLFDQNLSLTSGEPMHQTEMLALNIFETFYGRIGWEGVGQAKAVLFFILVVVIGLLQLNFTRRKEVQQ